MYCTVLYCTVLYCFCTYCTLPFTADSYISPRTQSEPQTRAGPLLPSSSVTFLHRLQTSITRSILKLECFLRPFLKTRSHDESAHTFKSSLQFWKCPKKGFKKKKTTFLDTFGLIGSVKNFFKSPGSWHECRPIYGLHFVYIGFFILYTKKGFWGSKKIASQVSAFFGHFGHQNG